MKISVLAGAALIALSTTTFAARPSVYPLRSQSASTQGIDNALCYAQARQQTGVDMARQPQRLVRTKTHRTAVDAGRGASEPPLPAVHGTADGSLRAAKGDASAGQARSASPADTQSIATTGGPSGAARKPPSTSGTASSGVAGLPPLPPPEPPMATYWQAYGDCMQSRGYGVQ